MALTVATNTGALMAQAAASSVNKDMELSMERLATGKRLNSASDDAAGVAIASRLTAEIKGTNQAIRNAMDGQALIDTAEGAHQEIESILQRMRELSVQASNDTNDANDRANLQLEMDQLSTEIDRISSTTKWAGQALMDGTGTFSFQVGSQTTAADSISASLSAMSTAGLGIGAGGTTTAANSASIAEVGENALQVSGEPAVGDVFNFTVGGTDMAVRLDAVGSTPVVSTTGTSGTTMSVANNVLTVTANNNTDVINVNVNGTDVQVTAGASAGATATAIKTAVDAHTGFAGMGVSLAVDTTAGTVTFSPATKYSISTDGGTTFAAASADIASNGVEGTAAAIAATINGRTANDFLGLTATAATDGSVSISQGIDITAASVTNGATATWTFGNAFDYADALTFTGLTTNGTTAVAQTATAGATITNLAATIASAQEVESTSINAAGTAITVTFVDVAGTAFSVTDQTATAVTISNGTITAGTTADTSKASVSSAGNVLTLSPVGYGAGEQVKFTMNGEAFTVTQSSTDKYDLNQAGMIDKIQDLLDASVKHGGLTFAVAQNSGDATKIDITATAATTTLAKDISAVAASTTTATSGLSVTTASSAQTSINAIDAAIQTLNSQRADLGAISNRLDSTVSNLTNISSNLQAGRGRIEDADFAAETTSLAKSQILQQASTAMLAQANASKQNVLSLLQG
jgi:flagellin